MNKLLTKIVGAALGLSMTVGVGVAVASNQNGFAAEATTSDKTAATAIESGQKYLVTAVYNSTRYYLTPGNSALGTGNVVATSISDVSTATESMCWTFTGSGTSWTIAANGFYLANTDSNNGVKTQASSQTWTSSFSSSNLTLTGSNSRKLSLYQGSNWRCYTSASGVQSLQIYKFSASNTPTITLSDASLTVPVGQDASFTVTTQHLTANFSVTGGNATYFSTSYTPSTTDGDHTVTLHGNAATTSPITLTVSSTGATSRTISITVMEITTYSKLTSVANLKAGSAFIIATTNGTQVLGKYVSGNNCPSKTATPTDSNTISSTNIAADYAIFTLSGSAGSWVLTDQDDKIYYGTSNNNYLKSSTDSTDTWVISITNAGVATITSNTSSRSIKKNGSSALFATYSSGQNDVSIYAVPSGSSAITAAEVEALISAIGTVEYTTACKAKIDAARAEADAYAEQSGCSYNDITNYSVLTTAETTYANLEKQAHADAVEDLIDAIGTVEYTAACKAKIDAARDAYDALTAEEKLLVSNYSDLTDAEAAYEALKPLLAEYVFTASSLAYTVNDYGGTWTASDSSHISGFESTGSARGVQIGAAKGEGTLTLNSNSLSTFDNYVCTSIHMIVSSNGTGNTLAVSVGGTAFTAESEETYAMSNANNYEVVFEGYESLGNVVVSYSDSNKSIWIKSISIWLEEPATITNSRMTAGTVSASTGDTEWTLDGFSFEVSYDNGVSYESVSASYTVSLPVPTINADGTLDVTVTGTYHGATVTSDTIHATLTYVNLYSIQRLYGYNLGLGETKADVTCDGIYMGYITHISSGTTYYDLFIGNGDYGIEVYGVSSAPSYTVGETYITVSGTLKNFNYLYEMTSATVSILSDNTRKSHVETPSTYVVTGSESASTLYLASRKTSLSGTVHSIGGVTTAGTTATAESNNEVYVTVGGNEVLLYVKAAQATADVASKIVVGDPITVEGFTTYYKDSGNNAVFEVLFETIIEADSSYHAADFAKDLLKLTRTICAASDEGNGSALTSVWTTLAGVDHWLKVEANGETSTLVNGTPSSSIVVPNTDAGIDAMSDADAIAAALYRYDWCTAKYHLTNFMERELTVSFGSRVIVNNNASYTAPIIAIVSVITLSAVAGYFMLRKRKEQ